MMIFFFPKEHLFLKGKTNTKYCIKSENIAQEKLGWCTYVFTSFLKIENFILLFSAFLLFF